MNYRLLISTPYHDWEEHFETQWEAETRLEHLQGVAEREQVYPCNFTLLQTVADITVKRKGAL